MKVEIADIENSQKKLKVEVPREKLDEAEAQELKKLLTTVKLPGFRSGKAPQEVVRKQYSHKIKALALEKTLNDSVRQAIISNNINPLNTPNVTDVTAPDGEPLSFTVTVDVYPEVKLEQIDGFEISKQRVKVSDEDVDKVIKGLREGNSYFVDAPEGKAAETGDKCIFDITADNEGADTVDEHGVETTIGHELVYKQIEDCLIGMKKGESKSLEFTFPENQEDPLSGKKFILTLSLKELKEKKLPDVDDEFVKKIDTSAASIDALRGNIMRSLDAQLNEEAKNLAYNELLDKIISVNRFDIPISLVQEQAKALYKDTLNDYYYRYGIDPKSLNINEAELIEKHKPLAEKLVKYAFIMNDIALKESFESTDEEVQNEAERFAERRGVGIEFVKEQMKKDPAFVRNFQNDIIRNKVFDYLCSRNTVIENEISADEFERSKKQEPNQEVEGGSADEGR